MGVVMKVSTDKEVGTATGEVTLGDNVSLGDNVRVGGDSVESDRGGADIKPPKPYASLYQPSSSDVSLALEYISFGILPNTLEATYTPMFCFKQDTPDDVRVLFTDQETKGVNVQMVLGFIFMQLQDALVREGDSQ